jgi:hypothetical protein
MLERPALLEDREHVCLVPRPRLDVTFDPKTFGYTFVTIQYLIIVYANLHLPKPYSSLVGASIPKLFEWKLEAG